MREGPKTEFECDRIEVLLQVQHTKARPPDQVADVEQYIMEYWHGEFTPGLRVEMWKLHRTTGRFSKLLEDSRAALAACAPYRYGNRKLLADEALARLASTQPSKAKDGSSFATLMTLNSEAWHNGVTAKPRLEVFARKSIM